MPGITGLRLSVPGWPMRCFRALPECRYHPNWLPPTPPESPDYVRHLPAEYSRKGISAHSLTIACLQICPGFHRTAVIHIRAFTVLLFYMSGLSQYCCSTPNRTIHKQECCAGADGQGALRLRRARQAAE